MRSRSMPLFQGLPWVSLLSGVPLGVTFAAAGALSGQSASFLGGGEIHIFDKRSGLSQ